MNGHEIRKLFIQFFESKGHLHQPSASLIPAGDPTLLFTSAGMVPFKPFFMGEETPPSRRLTSFQKSFRTTDIEEVGDHKHLTFFEMLGNFSIGDYFKEDAVTFSWELITEVFKLPPESIFVTIHLDDDDAYKIWKTKIGIPEHRIYRYGDKDNWWGPAGSEGPTGPCSELHFDGGAQKGCGEMLTPDQLTILQRQEMTTGETVTVPGCHPNCECERFVELWNLVFMQFYQDTDRNRTPLPAPSVDTGMGLERAAAVLQGKQNVYETDLFRPIVDSICKLSGQLYGVNKDIDYAIRVVAEHTRAATFLISDGVVPGNEGRGYVLRRIIRRAIRYGRRLGLTEIFLIQVSSVVLDNFGPVYRELEENRDFIIRVINLEEERFSQTMQTGIRLLEELIIPFHLWLLEKISERDSEAPFSLDNLIPDNNLVELGKLSFNPRHMPNIGWLIQELTTQNKATRYAQEINGEEVFLLHDTYGFPPELTSEICKEFDLDVDLEGFELEMTDQRERARSAQAFRGGMEILTTYENLPTDRTHFTGYQELSRDTVLVAIIINNESQDFATSGAKVEIILEETPFYAENGGQSGDRGQLIGLNGKVTINDTQSPVAGLIVHSGQVSDGNIATGESIKATVDIPHRMDASRNHSGTHLLHAALRSILGPHVRQAGSLVTPDRLRFDFSHVSGLTSEEQLSIQKMTNAKIRDNLTVTTEETSYADAVGKGALAFFGDRYGEVVRVVSMGDKQDLLHHAHSIQDAFSVEVCGGTHVSATGQVGTLFVLGESSIGGGMRRIEAITGRAAEELFIEQGQKLDAISSRLQAPVAELEARLDNFLNDTEDLRRRLEILERTNLRTESLTIVEQVKSVDGINVIASKTSATNPEAMREMGDFIKSRLSSAVIVLASVVNENPILVSMVTPDLVDRGLHAGNIARETSKFMGGGGGGQAEMAQAGGKDSSKLDFALSQVENLVRTAVKS